VNVTREDAGRYECVADNGVTPPARCTATLTVQCQSALLQSCYCPPWRPTTVLFSAACAIVKGRLVVLESGLGLESGLKSVFAGLGLGLGLGGSASKSFFKSFVLTRSIAL